MLAIPPKHGHRLSTNYYDFCTYFLLGSLSAKYRITCTMFFVRKNGPPLSNYYDFCTYFLLGSLSAKYRITCTMFFVRKNGPPLSNNRAWVCEKIPSGSNVLRKSLMGSHLRKFTKICFRHTFLFDWLTKHMASSFASELWNHFEFVCKLSFDWFGTPTSCPPYPVMGPI